MLGAGSKLFGRFNKSWYKTPEPEEVKEQQPEPASTIPSEGEEIAEDDFIGAEVRAAAMAAESNHEQKEENQLISGASGFEQLEH